MKWLALAVIAVVLSPMAMIAALATFFIGALTLPAIDETIRTNHCEAVGGDYRPVAGGSYRPPYLQEYNVTEQFTPPPPEEEVEDDEGDEDGQEPPGLAERFTGIEMQSTPPGAEVVAVAAGTVTFAGEGARGNTVEITHGDGVVARYSHLAQIASDIEDGEAVQVGQHLGVEGATGLVGDSRLHFAVIVDEAPIDPEAFMINQGAALNGIAMPLDESPDHDEPVEGGIGFDIPEPEDTSEWDTEGELEAPGDRLILFEEAEETYALPWTLFAAVALYDGTFGDAAQMQPPAMVTFTPEQWETYGTDGNGDRLIEEAEHRDQLATLANLLDENGVRDGPEGTVAALKVLVAEDGEEGDHDIILAMAQQYGGGMIMGSISGGCGTMEDIEADPNIPPIADDRVQQILESGAAKVGDPYVFGAAGPDQWDCSGFTITLFAEVGITMPRTARDQRDWAAAGNARRIQLGEEQPGDLIFYDTYLGPNTVGHVVIVWDPADKSTIEAALPGVGHYSYAPYVDNNIFEIWRVGNLTG